MKRTIVILLMLSILLTGCSEVTSDVAKTNTNELEKNNLIVEEKHEESTEEELVIYIDSVDYQVEALTSKQENLTVEEQKTLENTFITLTDFIFYGGTIKGKTFNELTTETKQKVLNLYEKIDSKIESKIPGYKEKISSTATKTYENVKEKVEDLKETIKNKYIEDYGQDKYNQVEESYNEAKDNITEAAKGTYNVIIDVTTEFYEETKNKAENWYRNYKESRN